MIGDRPTGQELVDALRAAAAKAGIPLYRFIEPISLSTPKNLLAQLNNSTKPVQATVDRVAALIAGEPIPAPRESPFRGHFGKRDRAQASGLEHRISGEVIEARRKLTDLAHERRLPGETIAAAVKRLQSQQSTISNLGGGN